jgi:hypothetical protein
MKGLFMRRTGLLVLSCVIFSCAPYFLYDTVIPESAAKPGKTLVVYLRSLNMPELHAVTVGGPNGGSMTTLSANEEGAESFVYADGKYIGGLTNFSLTMFDVDSGPRFIITEADFKSVLRINALPGKVFYIEEIPIQMGPLGVKPITQPISKQEAMEKIRTNTYKYSRPNPERKKKDMDTDDVQDCREDWEKWAKNNPDDAKKQAEYSGY